MLRSEPEGRGRALRVVPIPTGLGVFVASFSAKGLAQLDFPQEPLVRSASGDAEGISPGHDEWARITREAVRQTIAGIDVSLLPPLDLQNGSVFQRLVWLALQQIPRGETRSYAQVAAMIGKPKATRAVGSACGANPVPLLIPCHRVLAAGGKLGGFSGGLDWKKRLLGIEGVVPIVRSSDGRD
jgi:AraC family transcriptional regulator, regulatory protein of adaptative response / methylated-DNA-[protein]-cysteine methyltransferase